MSSSRFMNFKLPRSADHGELLGLWFWTFKNMGTDFRYGVAMISRMLKNICLFCKRALQKRPVHILNMTVRTVREWLAWMHVRVHKIFSFKIFDRSPTSIDIFAVAMGSLFLPTPMVTDYKQVMKYRTTGSETLGAGMKDVTCRSVARFRNP